MKQYYARRLRGRRGGEGRHGASGEGRRGTGGAGRPHEALSSLRAAGPSVAVLLPLEEDHNCSTGKYHLSICVLVRVIQRYTALPSPSDLGHAPGLTGTVTECMREAGVKYRQASRKFLVSGGGKRWNTPLQGNIQVCGVLRDECGRRACSPWFSAPPMPCHAGSHVEAVP